ncbi:hypothetical protein SAMN04488109_0164 [Chryseolinea serpens]|uniref:Quercetin 2,3-dioxygenase C-terminal cupin domain-containing protein n=1 Tax=Chryseolinea serpens TaxID=947013 RepID=A0A1M5JP25_9BACT|nr:hypothetical protein [Chryseolinea serpens]SHG41733.1 hypothetical protein SAMN04488109_0164 [Chryseolinea serpens]
MELEAMIYLAEKRGCTQTQVHRSFHSFNFGTYQLAHREPFGALRVFNDEALMPGASITYSLTDDYLLLLLPIAGGINFEMGAGHQFVEAGETAWINGRRGSVLTITNPYETGSVDFICAWITLPEWNDQPPVTLPFDLTTINTLHTLFASPQIKAHIGKFSGRTDHTFKTSEGSTRFFTFVLEGAFEFKERLLLQRDGLALNAVTEADFESLSDGAIVLILEV